MPRTKMIPALLSFLCMALALSFTNAQTAEEQDQLIPVIAVVDSGGPDQSSMDTSWTSFRAQFPNRPFCILRLVGAGDLLIPTDMALDGNVRQANVNRDGGDVFLQSDWFDLCDLYNNPITSVALLVDVPQALIPASLSFLQTRAGDNGQTVIQSSPQSDGNWIDPLNFLFLSSQAPSGVPSSSPSSAPTDKPSSSPSSAPTATPSKSPTGTPTGTVSEM